MNLPCSTGAGGSSFLQSPSSIQISPQKFTFFHLPTKRRPKIYRKRPIFRASSSGNSNSSNGFSWENFSRSLRIGSEKLGNSVDKGKDEFDRFRTEFVSWNRLELWKDFKNWEAKRVAALILYIFVAVFSCQRLYVAIRAPKLERGKKELTEAYMEAQIPDPSPSNVRKFKKSLSDDPVSSQESVKQIIGSDPRLNTEDRKELRKGLHIADETPERRTWRERLKVWKEILRKDKLSEQFGFFNARYAAEFDMKVVENSFHKDIAQKKIETQRRQINYFMKIVIALVPGLLFLWLIRESVMLLHTTSQRFLSRKYNQLFDMVYKENPIMHVGEVGDATSMYNEVVLGGDVWDVFNELIMYMRNPTQYYEKEVPLVRSLLLHGPPGTGKTLFARTLAKQSGLPFIYASGAEFTDIEKNGARKIREMFHLARRNAPSFIFIDEIDAIAGRRAKNDRHLRRTLEALIAQLDEEKERTGVDRFSLKQAVIFICATNIPDELDPEFLRCGCIDRCISIGLPGAKQRVQIFGVHNANKQLAEDVNFEEIVFRTIGYSGADIKNLVHEAVMMSVRKGHSKVHQQDIIDVLDKQLLEAMGLLVTEEELRKAQENVSLENKRLLAVHEAGHIVLAYLFPRFDWHVFSQLLPGGQEIGISVFYPREDIVYQGYRTFGYMIMQMVVAHGGRCAERVVFGDITDGGSHDLMKITMIAREMVLSPENSKLELRELMRRVGLNLPKSSNRWDDDPNVIPANMTPEAAELFTRQLELYIEETEKLAMNALRANRHILDVIADELLEKSKLTGSDVDAIVKGLSPVMFDDFVEVFEIHLEEEDPIRYQP